MDMQTLLLCSKDNAVCFDTSDVLPLPAGRGERITLFSPVATPVGGAERGPGYSSFWDGLDRAALCTWPTLAQTRRAPRQVAAASLGAVPDHAGFPQGRDALDPGPAVGSRVRVDS